MDIRVQLLLLIDIKLWTRRGSGLAGPEYRTLQVFLVSWDACRVGVISLFCFGPP